MFADYDYKAGRAKMQESRRWAGGEGNCGQYMDFVKFKIDFSYVFVFSPVKIN